MVQSASFSSGFQLQQLEMELTLLFMQTILQLIHTLYQAAMVENICTLLGFSLEIIVLEKQDRLLHHPNRPEGLTFMTA